MLARVKLEDEGISRHGRNTRKWYKLKPVPVSLACDIRAGTRLQPKDRVGHYLQTRYSPIS